MNAEELAKILDELGERLGPAGEHVFQITMQRVMMEGIGSIVFGSIAIAVLVTLWVKSKNWIVRKLAEPTSGYYSSSDALDVAFPVGLLTLALGFATVFAFIEVYLGVLKVTTLEYSTLSRLIEVIK